MRSGRVDEGRRRGFDRGLVPWCVAVIAIGTVGAGCGAAASHTVVESATSASLVAPVGTVPVNTVPVSTVPVSTAPISTAPISTVPARSPIVLGFAGDTSFTDGLDQRDPFGQVIEMLAAPDLMVVNLETAVADPGVGRPPVDKQFLFRSPPAALDLVVAAGIDVVALANNHTLDFGADALAQTLEEIDRRGLGRVGAGLDEADASTPLIVEVGDWTIGLVALSRVPCDWSASGENVRPQVAWACPALFARAEAAARSAVAQADVTVVMIHGGEEGVLCPSPFMLDLERTFAELGVDAVIDGHPHVLQGLTRHGETWVAHSLGNFAFPSARGITANSAIVQLHIGEVGSATAIELSVVPLRAAGGVLTVPTEAQRAEILGQVERYSQGVVLDADGRALVDLDHLGDC